MAKRRVFISHSNADPASDDLLLALHEELADDFDVLVDTAELRPGVDWRDEIYTWIGLCQAAVIILSPDARESDWVARETSILLWRRTLDASFLVIPAYVGRCGPAEFNQGLFRDLRLGEVQSASGAPADVVRSIVGRLRAEAGGSHSPLERIARQIEVELEGIADEALEAVAETLEVELGPWDPRDSRARSLALKMQQASFKKSVEALRILTEWLPADRAGRVHAILEWLEPAWVDLCAARWLAHCAASKNAKEAAVLNASMMEFTPDMYLRRASGKSKRTVWPSVPWTGVFGEGGTREAVNEIMESILLKAPPRDAFVPDMRECLEALIADRNEVGEPFFVFLRYSEAIREMLNDLQLALPNINFLVLTGEEFPDAGDWGGASVRLLEPRLECGAEVEARRQYVLAHSLVGKKER